MRTIIFSKDRACQLHLLLESLRQNDPHLLFDDIHVIYTFSNAEFARGYNMCRITFGDTIHFHQQGNLKSDVMVLLHSAASKFTVFFVDDVILYRRITFFENDIAELFKTLDTSLGCLSLRVGTNTVVLYQEDRSMYVPNFSYYDPFLVWNRKTAPPSENFNYPLSLDGHIFRTTDIKQWTALIQFSNPNELESELMLQHARSIPPLMACCEYSMIVNSPINRVQDQFRNKYGTVYSFTSEGLNEKYLEGKIIDLSSIQPDIINASHQELEVKFK